MRLRKLAAACGATAILGMVGLGVLPAFAEPPAVTSVIDVINTVDRPTVVVEGRYTGVLEGELDPTVTVNGDEVADLSVQAADPLDATVLVLDNSSRAEDQGRFQAMKDALKAYVAGMRPGERVALVVAGGSAEVRVQLTSDPAGVLAAIDSTSIADVPFVYSAIQKAADEVARYNELPSNGPDLVEPKIVVVALGTTDRSPLAADAPAAAADAVRAVDSSVHFLGLAGSGDFEIVSPVYSRIAVGTGGSFTEVTLEDVVSQATVLSESLERRGYALSFDQGEFAEDVRTAEVKVAFGDVSSNAAYDPNAARVINAPTALGDVRDPATVIPGVGIDDRLTKLVIVIVASAAVGLFALAIMLLMTSENVNLDTRLSVYDDPDDVAKKSGGPVHLGQSGIVKAAVARTTELAERQGLLGKVESRLEQAAISVRAGELIFFSFSAAVVAGLVGIAVMGLLGIPVGFFLGLLFPASAVNFKAARRLSRFNSQLPDMLQLMSSSLRAGYSVVQAVDAVAAEVNDPMGTELRRVITEAQLGRPMNDALLDCATRMNSRDFEWAVLAINIQREVGGNLSELLDTVAETMIERERLRREVKSLTAEGRVSAGVLVCMPIALGAVMYTINPAYVGVLFNETLGQVFLGAGILAMVVGFFWMKKTITIKV